MREAVRTIEKYQPLWGFWRVEELITQGSGCEVYKAYKEEWGKRYTSTVKLMSFSIDKTDIKEAQAIGIDAESMPEYFKSTVGSVLNEIELMYKLRGSSNIVIYEDHAIYRKKDDLGWDVLIRTEYLQPLPDFQIGRKLGRSEVAKLGIDICKALEACGREGIIHRDIKDSSIYVSTKGEFKLGSFSLAKELLKGRRIALAQCSPLYMAPELYKEQSYDSTVDIYSLGIVMYKLLNRGRLPFLPLPPDNITVDDTERSIASRMAGEQLTLPLDAGGNLGAIILKACSYDKKDRYKSPYEFRQKLERFLKADAKPLKEASSAVSSSMDSKALEADTQAAYSEELERIAVAELAASADKCSNAVRQRRNKLIKTIGIWASLMVLSFAFAFICTYKAEPIKKEPIAEATAKITEKITQVSPTPIIPPTISPEPTLSKSGEEYFNEAVLYKKNRKYESALAAFGEAKKLGYDNEKVNIQVRTIKKEMEVQKLYKRAAAYYEQQDYEKAIATFTELTRIDAAYTKAVQFEDSFLQLAKEHNLEGVRQYNEGKLEQAGKEFDEALNELESMKACINNYDQQQYSKFKAVYIENRDRMVEKAEKIEVYLKLADECNKLGVMYFKQGSVGLAKLKFENAVKYLKDIRLLVPNYSYNGYDGLLQIYEGNLKRTENKHR